jgi:hypothetical protein
MVVADSVCCKSKSSVPHHILDVLLPHGVALLRPVQRSPDWFPDEESHQLQIQRNLSILTYLA